MKKDSADGRILIWKISIDMIKEHPLKGFGANGFKENYMNYQAKYFNEKPESNYQMLAGDNSYAFNEYLKVFTEFGIAGILIIGVLFYIVFFYKRKQNTKETEQKELYAIRCLLISFMAFSCFSYPTEFIQFRILLCFLLARAANSLKSIVCRNFIFVSVLRRINPIPFASIKYSIFSCVLVSGFIIYNSSIHLYTIYEVDKLVKFSSYQKDNTTEIDIYNKADYILKSNATFQYLYGIALYKNQDYEKAIAKLNQSFNLHSRYITKLMTGNVLKKSGNYCEAHKAWTKANKMIPSRFLPLTNLMEMYEETKETENAKKYAELIINKKEKVDSPHSFLMKKKAKKILCE